MTVLTLNKLNFDELKVPALDVPELAITDDDTPPVYISDKERREKFLHDIRITAISGDEGDGKSLLMTKFGKDFYHMGGQVVTFPGYELKENGKVVSQTLTLEQWVKLDPQTLKGKLVLIDEIIDFCDATLWQTNFVKITTGVYGQRRHTNTGLIYTLQYFEELPKSLRRKTAYLIDCKDAARYNDVRSNQVREGTKTYTKITDLHGRKNLHIRGLTYRGPTYYNQDCWENYSTEKNPDIMSKFINIKINRPTIEIDLDGDGKITEKEKVDGQKLLDEVINGLTTFCEKNIANDETGVSKKFKGMEYWKASHLNQHNPAHQAIAAQANEMLGIQRTAKGFYYRDPATAR